MPLGNDDAANKQFMEDAIAWLDGQDCVERYAYFGTADEYTSLLENGGPPLSELGEVYAFTSYAGGGDGPLPPVTTGNGGGGAKRKGCSRHRQTDSA